MNEHNRPSGRLRRLLPDDPRVESCLRWLATCTLTPPTKSKIQDAILETIEESGELALEEVGPEDEVREPGLAEEVQGREVP